jgi:hypothetical protein
LLHAWNKFSLFCIIISYFACEKSI